jgi:hypothetical protein
MKNQILKIIWIVILLWIIVGITYAVNSHVRFKSPVLPWQGTSSGDYLINHNVWHDYLPQDRFSFTGCYYDIVYDNVTGLSWESGSWMYWTYYDAVNYCNSLNLCWYSGWSLPNYKELLSIVDYSRSRPAIDTNYFSNNYNNRYFTLTPALVSSSIGFVDSAVWTVDFWYWSSEPYSVTYDGINNNFAARCVLRGSGSSWPVYSALGSHSWSYVSDCRSGDQNFEFYDYYYGIVHDKVTDLYWTSSGSSYLSWTGALEYCDNLNYSYYWWSGSGWRLPDITELYSIANLCVADYNDSIFDTAYFNVYNDHYWSSTTNNIRGTSYSEKVALYRTWNIVEYPEYSDSGYSSAYVLCVR